MRTIKIILVAILGCGFLHPCAQAAEPKVLNNLVTELVNIKSVPAKPAYQEIAFTNPREGWIFVSASTSVKNDDVVAISIDADKEEAVLKFQSGDAGTKETMRLLSAGEHKLRIWFPEKPESGKLDIQNLIIRTVPAMIYCAHPSVALGGYGVYDLKFLEKDVLPNINTIVGSGSKSLQELHKQWKADGREWYLEQNLPSAFKGSREDLPDPLTADAIYNYWTKSSGFTNPYLDGIYGDEFMWKDSQIPDLPGYVEALKRIAANPEFKNKKVHGWMYDTQFYTEPGGKALTQAFLDSGAKIAWEFYASERDTADLVRKDLYETLSGWIKGMEKNVPGMVKSLVLTIGYLSAPPESLNTNPAADFKVHMDMQFNYLANAPECNGMYGIMMYKSRYADEEYVRWAGRLFRHYCIEGKRTMLSDEDEYGFKYIPGHIQNPDFNDGLKGWTVAAAAKDSVQAGTMKGLSALLCRFLTPEQGDNYMMTKRSANKPNKVSQEIKNLVPGKLYSAKLFVADYQDLTKGQSVQKKLAISLDIDNVDMIPEKRLVQAIHSRSKVGPFKGKTPPWMIHYRLVFRAKDKTAKLTISDWPDEAKPGGPVGQEILYNFVEVQPYIED